MARSAVLAGRTTADLIRNVGSSASSTAVGLRGRVPDRDEHRRVHRGALLHPRLRLRAQLGCSAVIGLIGPEQRDGTADGLPGAVSSHLRLLGVRPGLEHAGLAAGLRVSTSRSARHQRRPGPDDQPPGRQDRCSRSPLHRPSTATAIWAGPRLDRRDPPRPGTAGGTPVPLQDLEV